MRRGKGREAVMLAKVAGGGCRADDSAEPRVGDFALERPGRRACGDGDRFHGRRTGSFHRRRPSGGHQTRGGRGWRCGMGQALDNLTGV